MLGPNVNSYLANGEEIMYVTKRHWVALFRATLLPIIVVAPMSIAISYLAGLVLPDIWWLKAIPLVLLACNVGYVYYQYLLWKINSMHITPLQVLDISGVFNHDANRMYIDHISDVTVKISLIGRILGYGTIRLESTGQKQSVELFEYIPHPFEVDNAINTLRDQLRSGVHQY